MKVKAALVLSVILFGIVPLTLVLGIGAFLGSNTPTAVCIDSGSTLLTAENISNEELTVKDEPIDEAQRKNAATIISVALENGLPSEAAVVAIMTAIQESTLINLHYGYPGSTSAGLFQQVAAWGSYEDRTNPEKSPYMFYFGGQAGQSGLTDIDGWQEMTPGDAAQAVQRSGFPDAYDQWEPEARAIVASFGSDEDWADVQLVSAECAIDPIEKMVQAALSRVDQPIGSISSSGASARVGTYNVLGSNHTTSESAMRRIATAVSLIKSQSLGVVGLQELRPDQRERLLELSNGSYDIYPRTPVYGESQMSANSIIWDTSQFELVGGRATPMPFYFGGQRLDIPLVELRHLGTDTVITIVNTHDPAKPENDRLRYLNAQEHAELTDTLAARGAKVFWTGDFNSGFAVRNSGNTTFLNDRDNLTWCIMTRSGVLVNGYDDLRGRQGCSQQTSEEKGVGPVDHVYVPRDGVKTVGYELISEGTGSDHPLVFAEVTLGETEPSDMSEVGTSAELVSWAANEAGLTLPDTLSDLYEFEASPDDGVSSELLPPDTTRMRGDITLWSTDEDPDPEQAGIELGAVGAGSEFRLASYNITVKRKFANYALAVENITSTHKMDIVGTQELIGDSYRTVQEKVKAAGYGIYPDYAPGLRTVRHGLSGRSIVYNEARFILDKAQTTFFRHPRYPTDGPAKIGEEQVFAGQANVPVAFFTDRVTEQPLIVINFHNVAFAEHAERRYQSNLILVEQVRQLQASHPGVPIFLTGDFNEGTGVRRPGSGSANLTYQSDYRNLLYCMFAENGLMESAATKAAGRAMSCPNQSIGGVDYIYVMPQTEVAQGGFREISPAQAGSDHSAIFADVAVPAAAGLDKADTTLAVGLKGDHVELVQVDSRTVVGVQRLTVNTAVTVNVTDKDGWVFPLRPGDSHYSDAYGLEDGRFHNGADFGTSGTSPPLYAMHGGTLLNVGWGGAWGNYLVVETGVPVSGSLGETYKYLYAHLSSIAPGLQVGGTLTANQHVGAVGDTGNSYGEHLHLTICTDMRCLEGSGAESAGSVDPIPFMEALGIWPQSNVA